MNKSVFPTGSTLTIKCYDCGRLILTICGQDDFSTHWIYFGATLWSPLQAWQLQPQTHQAAVQVDLANLAKNQVETEKTSLISLRQRLTDTQNVRQPYVLHKVC